MCWILEAEQDDGLACLHAFVLLVISVFDCVQGLHDFGSGTDFTLGC